MSFAHMDEAEARQWTPRVVVFADGNSRIVKLQSDVAPAEIVEKFKR